MEQQNMEDLIPFYLNNTLSPQDRQAFEAQLAQDPALQRALAEWRTIATVVWHETDTIARQLPPLSPALYQKLQYRQGNGPRTAVNNTPVTPEQHPVPRRSSSRIPLTMVAGLLITLVFGAFLVILATRPPSEDPTEIAALSTASGSVTPGFGAPDRLIPTATGNGGIIAPPLPTLTPLPTQQLTTALPLPSPVIIPGSGGGGMSTPVAPDIAAMQTGPVAGTTLVPTATNDRLIPQTNDCSVYNLEMQVNIHQQANRTSVVVGRLPVGVAIRTIVISQEGWHQVVDPGNRVGWVAPEDVQLQGNCTDLWLATPTIATTPTIPAAVQPVPGNQVAVIDGAFADIREIPSRNGTVLLVAERDQVWEILGTMGTAPEQWLLTRLPNGRDGWLNSEDVSLMPAEELTPQPTTPTPTPDQAPEVTPETMPETTPEVSS